MKKIEIPIYKFEELSEDAKEKAKSDYAIHYGYAWADEQLNSLKALAKHFGGKIADYELDWFGSSHSYVYFDIHDLEEEEIAKLIGELGPYDEVTGKGLGSCVLTGYCGDEDAIDGLRIAWRKGERDIDELLRAAYETWIEAAQEDCKSQYENEQFAEHCEANEYEFFQDGELVTRKWRKQ